MGPKKSIGSMANLSIDGHNIDPKHLRSLSIFECLHVSSVDEHDNGYDVMKPLTPAVREGGEGV